MNTRTLGKTTIFAHRRMEITLVTPPHSGQVRPAGRSGRPLRKSRLSLLFRHGPIGCWPSSRREAKPRRHRDTEPAKNLEVGVAGDRNGSRRYQGLSYDRLTPFLPFLALLLRASVSPWLNFPRRITGVAARLVRRPAGGGLQRKPIQAEVGVMRFLTRGAILCCARGDFVLGKCDGSWR